MIQSEQIMFRLKQNAITSNTKFIIKIYLRTLRNSPSMIEPNIVFDRTHDQRFGNLHKMKMNREYSMNLSTSQINLNRVEQIHQSRNKNVYNKKKQLANYNTATSKQKGCPSHKLLKQDKGNNGEKWGDTRELRWGQNKKMEIRVMKPNLIKPTQDKNKLNKRKSDGKNIDKQNKHEKLSRYIQTQINLSDLQFKTRIVNPSKNIQLSESLKSALKEKRNFQRSLSKQNRETVYFQSKNQYEKIKTECDENLWTRMERSISKAKDKNSKLNLKPSYCSPAMSGKMLQKLQEIKEIGFISEHLSDLQIEGILNELQLMDIAEARWPLLIVDRVYQIMRRQDYK